MAKPSTVGSAPKNPREMKGLSKQAGGFVPDELYHLHRCYDRPFNCRSRSRLQALRREAAAPVA